MKRLTKIERNEIALRLKKMEGTIRMLAARFIRYSDGQPLTELTLKLLDALKALESSVANRSYNPAIDGEGRTEMSKRRSGNISGFSKNNVGVIIQIEGQRVQRYFFFADRIIEGGLIPKDGQAVLFLVDPKKPVPEGRLPRATGLILREEPITADQILADKKQNASSEAR